MWELILTRNAPSCLLCPYLTSAIRAAFACRKVMENSIDVRMIGVALSDISTLSQLGNFDGNLQAAIDDLLYVSSMFKVSVKRSQGKGVRHVSVQPMLPSSPTLSDVAPSSVPRFPCLQAASHKVWIEGPMGHTYHSCHCLLRYPARHDQQHCHDGSLGPGECVQCEPGVVLVVVLLQIMIFHQNFRLRR